MSFHYSLLNGYHYSDKSLKMRALDTLSAPLRFTLGGRHIEAFDQKNVDTRCRKFMRIAAGICLAVAFPIALVASLALLIKSVLVDPAAELNASMHRLEKIVERTQASINKNMSRDQIFDQLLDFNKKLRDAKLHIPQELSEFLSLFRCLSYVPTPKANLPKPPAFPKSTAGNLRSYQVKALFKSVKALLHNPCIAAR